jgi:outer membrane protein OmpA-like peptidoglycan-associated protein
MATSLLDSLGQVIGPDINARVAARLGEPEQNVSRGVRSGVASIFAGLLGKTSDPGAMRGTFDLITDSANDGRVLDDVASFAEATGSKTPIMDLGGRLLSGLFGGQSSTINDLVAKSSGLRSSSVMSIMHLAAPLVLGFLGRRVRDGGLTQSSFTQMLLNEKDQILRAAPPGIANVLGIGAGAREEMPRREHVEEPARAYTRPTHEPPPGGSRRLWPVLAALVAIFLLWAVWPRHGRRVAARVDTARSQVAGGEVAPPAGTTAPVGFIRKRLPNGTEVSIPITGTESKVVAFIEDPSRRVDNTTWFEFDRLNFETNSANLLPQSEEQLKNIAGIMAAYPNVRARIGGFTDNTGNAAANKRLSEQRAENVRQALVQDGVAAERITAQGYGSAHPVASNATEEGRAKNRRIALLITNK